MFIKRYTAAWAVAVAALCAAPAQSSAQGLSWFDFHYTQTRHPIVLVHGVLGFDNIGGLVDYFFGVPQALEAGGAKVYVVKLSSVDTHEERGEQLLRQLGALKAAHGFEKFNLVAHSQGGHASRYAARMQPELVASVTTMQTPHQGSGVADWVAKFTVEHPEGGELLIKLSTEMLKALDWLTGASDREHDAIGNVFQLTTAMSKDWNLRYSEGAPTTPCGSGARVGASGVHYYSAGGAVVTTNLLDVSDLVFAFASPLGFPDGTPNDGLVSSCSSRWGEVLRADYPWNHADGVNQVMGLRGLLAPDPLAFYRSHANRLKKAGL
ncbi:triacylglycerol lipase [Aquabacterium sp. A7-Y]|uniref:esterase/lipase family protein n=1 Tax=Aquabacterium sp. A7-Y TaxID=1349605 RepID=UPI00223DFB8A|nr:triacylglycerol lipase [Aquabacterium sp. A7-Y]MCW7540838.1 triacylglycerol lipase [Aquabacterium sp. A7-Y]